MDPEDSGIGVFTIGGLPIPKLQANEAIKGEESVICTQCRVQEVTDTNTVVCAVCGTHNHHALEGPCSCPPETVNGEGRSIRAALLMIGYTPEIANKWEVNYTLLADALRQTAKEWKGKSKAERNSVVRAYLAQEGIPSQRITDAMGMLDSFEQFQSQGVFG